MYPFSRQHVNSLVKIDLQMMKDTPSSAVLAVEHADAPNQKNEVFWGISTFSIPFFAGNLSYALLFLENSHIATPEFSFLGGMEQKKG